VTPVADTVPTPEGTPRTSTGPVVVKIGGRALETPGASRELAAEVASLSGGVLLVHGGGAEVSAWSRRLGSEPRFVDGLRVSDVATLEVAVAVLAGLANKRLVAALRAAGVDAVGLSAADGGIAKLARHPRAAELGAVGAVEAVDGSLLAGLLAGGRTPVLASIGALDGSLLNVNADDLAAALAIGLDARALVLLSDVPGVRLEGATVARLDPPALESALAGGEVGGGMTPKLRAAQAVVAAGVPAVHIAAWEGPGSLAALLAGSGRGTAIVAASEAEVLRG
jgi:acetylglutamate kinase